jgi:DNA ligase D-like protein (predicted ligase)
MTPSEAPLAGDLRPMLPTIAEHPFDSPDYIYEVKWGGVRTVAVIDHGDVRLHGRNLRDLTPLYPELQTLSTCLPVRHAVLDGEICAWANEEMPSFELLRPRLLRPDQQVAPPKRSPIVFQLFDLLELDGTSLLEQPLFERRNSLHLRLRPNRYVQAADFVREDGTALFEAVASHGLEGIIAKDKHSSYLPGQRSSAWQEVRATQSDDFIIGGYTFGGGRPREPISSLLLGTFRSGELDFVGEVSIGCSSREARQLLDLLTPLHTKVAPFASPPPIERFFYWCRPELATHIKFSQWARDGRLRFPVFVAPRPDIPPEECVRLSA